MRKNYKKIVVITLCLTIVFNVVWLGTFTVSADNPTSGTCGGDLTWNYDENSYTLTIRGTGWMKGYSNTGTTAPWRPYYETMKTVLIESGVKSIGRYAFYGCTGLTSITIPDSVTNIESYAFSGCTGLTSVTIPDSVTSIGGSAFSGCTGLASITIPNSVTNIRFEAFDGCTGLTSLNIPDSVTSIEGEAFCGCTGITSITIPSNVSYIGSCVFSYCNGLASIKVSPGNAVYHSSKNCLIETANKILISGCKTSSIPEDGSVTSIGGGAFEGCAGLTNITIPDTVTSIGDAAFKCCTGLVSISIPGNVTKIGYAAFSGCTGITSVIIPNSVLSIGDYAFYNCNSIRIIYIPLNTTRIGVSAFQGTSLKDIYYGGDEADRHDLSIADNNSKVNYATWHYNSKMSDMTSNPDNPDNPGSDVSTATVSAPTGTKSLNWRYRAHLVASAENLPERCHIAWYEGNTKVSDNADFTTGSLTSNHTYTAKIVDASGTVVSNSAQEKTVKVEVKTDFFSKIISFFSRLFGSDVVDI
ncbi:MAG: leucine-rich repeat domain-containing protein [Clostridia bacterium]|nr:leucine-rich repeat domain-containing protein [Clostridia bacterium]